MNIISIAILDKNLLAMSEICQKEFYFFLYETMAANILVVVVVRTSSGLFCNIILNNIKHVFTIFIHITHWMKCNGYVFMSDDGDVVYSTWRLNEMSIGFSILFYSSFSHCSSLSCFVWLWNAVGWFCVYTWIMGVYQLLLLLLGLCLIRCEYCWKINILSINVGIDLMQTSKILFLWQNMNLPKMLHCRTLNFFLV